MQRSCLILACFLLTSWSAIAGEVDVLDVKVERSTDGSLKIYTTVQHDDEGWDHYADRWEVLDMEGNLLDTRVLKHPHTATPFTRTLPWARIPEGTEKIRIRAHDSVHGYGGKEVVAQVPGK